MIVEILLSSLKPFMKKTMIWIFGFEADDNIIDFYLSKHEILACQLMNQLPHLSIIRNVLCVIRETLLPTEPLPKSDRHVPECWRLSSKDISRSTGFVRFNVHNWRKLFADQTCQLHRRVREKNEFSSTKRDVMCLTSALLWWGQFLEGLFRKVVILWRERFSSQKKKAEC